MEKGFWKEEIRGMDTAFDDSESQPGMAQGMFGPWRKSLTGPGLGSTLQKTPGQNASPAPADGYITVTQYQGENHNGAGHVGVSINGGPSYGLGPWQDWMGPLSAIMPVPGVIDPVKPDRTIVDQVKIPATAEQLERARQHMLKNAGPTVYDLEGRNCATFADGTLKAGGLRAPTYPGDVLPSDLLKALHKLYDKPVGPAQPHLIDTRPTPPKY